MNRIITIGREFGSGGRELGRRLAEQLQFAYYDQEIISEISRRTSLSEQYVHSIVEHQPVFSFPIHIGRSFHPTANPVFEQTMSIYQEQARIISEMADQSDCVIVGRCADYILKEQKPFRIFVYADMESKIIRCREKAPEDERLTDKELKQKISGMDKKRAQYYEFYTRHSWGDRLNYDLCINTTQTVIKEIVPAIAKLFYSISQ
ncbi:MAG: cytidylate kinase-like family protein [Lachnospiraceae bacterium]|nr:cytidylate kinase-like family protein [Lachnospiraceae bacterium]